MRARPQARQKRRRKRKRRRPIQPQLAAHETSLPPPTLNTLAHCNGALLRPHLTDNLLFAIWCSPIQSNWFWATATKKAQQLASSVAATINCGRPICSTNSVCLALDWGEKGAFIDLAWGSFSPKAAHGSAGRGPERAQRVAAHSDEVCPPLRTPGGPDERTSGLYTLQSGRQRASSTFDHLGLVWLANKHNWRRKFHAPH